MLWSEYQGIEQIVLKMSFIWTYERIGVRMDDRSTETLIFDQGVLKYVRITAIIIFDQFLRY